MLRAYKLAASNERNRWRSSRKNKVCSCRFERHQRAARLRARAKKFNQRASFFVRARAKIVDVD